MERDFEINQIKAELEILRAGIARYRQLAEMLRISFGFFVFALVVFVIFVAAKLFLFDPLYGLFFTVMFLILGGAVAYDFKSIGVSWIDVAALPLRRIYRPAFFYPDANPKPRNDVEQLEWQIADREKRLSELANSVA